VGSASSFILALMFAAWSASETSGHWSSRDPSVWTRICATSACVTHQWSAGMTYQGAHGVEVAVSASSKARSAYVIIEVSPLGDVGRVELPFLAGAVESRDEPLLLDRLRDVQEELDDLRAVAVEVALEGIDVLVALLPERLVSLAGREALRREPLRMHLQRDDLLVVRAVEDADASPPRQCVRDPPEVVVPELLGRWPLERDDLHTLRVHARHDVLDHGVLAGRVHRLEDDEQRVSVTRPQQLLCLRELRDPSSDRVLRPLRQLVRRKVRELVAAGPPRIPCREARA
jgi:hypothetical protein